MTWHQQVFCLTAATLTGTVGHQQPWAKSRALDIKAGPTSGCWDTRNTVQAMAFPVVSYPAQKKMAIWACSTSSGRACPVLGSLSLISWAARVLSSLAGSPRAFTCTCLIKSAPADQQLRRIFEEQASWSTTSSMQMPSMQPDASHATRITWYNSGGRGDAQSTVFWGQIVKTGGLMQPWS